MFDFRYHLVSLVAVFLALTIGLLLGSLVADKGVLARQQERLMDSVRADVGKLAERNYALEREVNDLRAFREQVLAPAVRDRLKDKRVAVISVVEGQDALYQQLAAALSAAGAKPVHVYFNVAKLDFANEALRAKFSPPLSVMATESAGFESAFWARAVREIAGREPPALTDKLSAESLMTTGEALTPADRVVLLATDRERVANRDLLVLEALKGVPDLVVVAAEAVDQKPSRVGAFQMKNVSTVDNVDTVAGHISLVYALQGPGAVNFGVKSTADKLMP